MNSYTSLPGNSLAFLRESRRTKLRENVETCGLFDGIIKNQRRVSFSQLTSAFPISLPSMHQSDLEMSLIVFAFWKKVSK